MLKRLHLPSLFLGAFLCAVMLCVMAVGGVAYAQNRPREPGKLANIDEVCFTPVRPIPRVTDAGLGGALVALKAPTDWQVHFAATFYPDGNSSVAQEDPFSCSRTGLVLPGPAKADLEAFLTARFLATMKSQCKVP